MFAKDGMDAYAATINKDRRDAAEARRQAAEARQKLAIDSMLRVCTASIPLGILLLVYDELI